MSAGGTEIFQLGASDVLVVNEFRWESDGELMSVGKSLVQAAGFWCAPEPNGGSTENYVNMNSCPGGGYNDLKGTDLWRFVCEHPRMCYIYLCSLVSSPSATRSGWIFY